MSYQILVLNSPRSSHAYSAQEVTATTGSRSRYAGFSLCNVFFPKVGATQCLQFAKKNNNCILLYFIETEHLKKERNAPRLLVHKEVCILENNFLGLFSNAIYFSGVIAYFKSRSTTLIIEKF